MLLGNRNRLATFVNLFTKYLAPSRRTNPIVGDVPVFEGRRSEPRQVPAPESPPAPDDAEGEDRAVS